MKKDERDYLEEIKAELKRLGTFGYFWKKKNEQIIYFESGFANADKFIRLGGIQKGLLEIAYFQQGFNDVAGLSLCPRSDKTWKDVLDALREIESIEI